MLKEPNLAKEAGQGLLGIVSSYARGDLGGVASTALGFFKKATTGDETYQRNLRTKTSPADVVMWSGSKDSQTSYVDPSFPDEPQFPFLFKEELQYPVLLKEEPTYIKIEEVDTSPFQNFCVPYTDMKGRILA